MLRPPALQDAFARFLRGDANGADLARAEDDAIRDLVAKQEELGFPVIVDGEFRRPHYLASFAEVEGARDWLQRWAQVLEGLGRERPETDGAAEGHDPVQEQAMRVPATAPLRLVRNRPLDEYRFTSSLTKQPVKVTILGPDRVQSLHAIEDPESVYDDPDRFIDDVVAVEREMIRQLVEHGCRYVHIDEPGFTSYVDEHSLAAMRARGADPQVVMERSIRASNALIAGFPDVTFGVHLCRGNRQSQWHREGTYDAIAEQVLGGLDYDRLLLEYDTDRAGGFEALRFVRKGTVVVLGLLTTKSGELEERDVLMRRIDEAARYVPIEQLALSTQCGFASSLAGNLISEAEQWRKLERVLDVAAEVWG
jgi:5-methyltetrahydropteroyltriglutamate--homocysteine methyltransferase